MKKQKRYLYLDSEEYSVVLHSLVQLKNKLIKEGRYPNADNLPVSISTMMERVIRDEDFQPSDGILHHAEGVDLMPSNIELSAMEMTLVNAMSREFTLRTYINEVKKNYDYVIIDCMPSLGMITVNGAHRPPCRTSVRSC